MCDRIKRGHRTQGWGGGNREDEGQDATEGEGRIEGSRQNCQETVSLSLSLSLCDMAVSLCLILVRFSLLTMFPKMLNRLAGNDDQFDGSHSLLCHTSDLLVVVQN